MSTFHAVHGILLQRLVKEKTTHSMKGNGEMSKHSIKTKISEEVGKMNENLKKNQDY